MNRLILSLFVICTFPEITFSQHIIQGLVKDDAEEILIGATIKIKEDPLGGTISDLDGRFSLVVPEQGKTLVISFTGYVTQEILLIDGKSDVEVVLRPSITALDEVVVVGYGPRYALRSYPE